MSQPAYQINDLERLTGIKSHTIRIWEKRYKLVEPFRTPTNIRYYDDNQVRKLLNVATLLESGFKISKIAALSEAEINQSVQELREQPQTDIVCRSFINDLVVAMLAYDEAAFEKTFSASVTRFGLYEAMLRVIYPFLHKAGLLWSVSETMPAQEHFASCIVRKKLMSACDGLPAARPGRKKFVLFLPPGEWHDIGLLFSEYIIRQQGNPVLYLGQNVPFSNLSQVVEQNLPDYILTFFVTGRPAEEQEEFMTSFTARHPGVTVLFSGSAALSADFQLPSSCRKLSGPDDLLRLL